MAFTRLTTDLNIHQSLPDEPNDVGGLSAAQLKAKWDEAVNIVKTYLNTSLISELEGTNAASYLGLDTSGDENPLSSIDPPPTSVQEALAAIIRIAQQATTGDIPPGGISTILLASEAVTGEKIAAGAVGTAKIVDEAITAEKLADDAVTTDKVVDGAVTADKLADALISADKIDTNAVTADKINTAAVTAGKIATNAVETAKIKDANVTQAKLAANAVSTVYSGSISTTWTGSAAPYSQEVSVSGLLSTDTIVVDINPSSTYATAQNQLDAWADVYRFVVGANKLTVYAHAKTTTAIPIKIIAIRR